MELLGKALRYVTSQVCQLMPARGVVLQHEPTGLYLAGGNEWSVDPRGAVAFPNEQAAVQFVELFACEPAAFAVVPRGALQMSAA